LYSPIKEASVSQTIRLGDKIARGEIKALRELSQEDRLRLLISGMAETSGSKEDDDGVAFRRRLAAQRITSRRTIVKRVAIVPASSDKDGQKGG
jgi:hypothetical protein